MKRILGFIACFTCSATAWSQQTVAEFKLIDLPKNGLSRQAAWVSLDGQSALKIENTNESPLQLSILTMAQPKISAERYAVLGEVRYDGVQGDSFLEMWSYFPPVKPGLPEGQYFSRTLGDSGEMGKISGTSDWRPFSLPFDRTGGSGPPTKLQINLILKGRGTVYLGPLKLVQYPVAKTAFNGEPGYAWFFGRTENPWWSVRGCNWLSICGGGVFASLGILISALCQKGKGRGFVVAMLRIQIGLGIPLVVAGIVAFALHQPFIVWFPLSLFGLLQIGICTGWLFTVGKYYQERELRRMQALDA